MSAPSFSSFPPSFSSFPDLDASQASSSKTIPNPQSQRKKDDKHKRKGQKSKGEGDQEQSDERERAKHKKRVREPEQSHKTDEYLKELEDSRKRTVEPEDFRNTSPPVFFSDRKGDMLNVKYGRLHAGDIPKYSLVGRGRRILGLGEALLVLHRSRQGLEVGVAGTRRRAPALTDSSARHLLRAAPTKRLVTSPEDRYKYVEVDGFLRLPSTGPKKTVQSNRDITTAARDSQESDSSSEDNGASDSDDSDTIHSTSRQETLKSLEAQLSIDPTSVRPWLSLLSHTLADIPPDTKNAQKARAEIALSVLSRALSAHPSNAQSQQLRLKYLSAGEDIWTLDVLNSEWEIALKIGSTDLWVQWLDWRIRAAPRGVEGVTEDARRVFASLPTHDENGRLRAFWRLAVALRDAGFVEHAHALFQAQAELLFCRPPDLNNSMFNEQLGRLEEFWDSEAPRLGEAGASGWAIWESSGRSETSIMPSRPAITKSALTDPHSRWAMNEWSAFRGVHALPTRTNDEGADSDPYSTILFSDIRPFLLDLRLLKSKESFRLIWLSFLGVHTPGLSASLHDGSIPNTDDRWSATHFASPEFLSSIFPSDVNKRAITADAQAGVLLGREREYSATFGPVKQWGMNIVSPLEGIGNDRNTALSQQDLAGVNKGVVRQIFQQCQISSVDKAWHALYLAFEGALNTKSAVKTSKSLLAEAKDSLIHWAYHARLERLRGRLDEARKLYSTVLSSAAPGAVDSGILWWDWAELEWQSHSPDPAVKIILRSTSTNGDGTVAVLRSKRRLDEFYQDGPPDRWKEQQAWLKLRALLELLTGSVEGALFILDMEIGRLNEGTIAHESLTVASLLMLYVHGSVLRNPVAPALLRDRAERAISQYPSNTIILALFLEAEKGQAVWGKVRLVLGETTVAGVMREKDLSRRVAEVWAAGWEKGRWKAEQERVRSSLSAAAQDERTRGSAILWRVYLEFEIRAGQLSRAKKLLFRAIGECPLVKELYLIAFVQLRGVFTTRELNELAETMAERGIRLREGIDEALEGWSESNTLRKDEALEDYGDEVIEYNADELRRLKPY
ncbi:NRDE-2, necessary for RNA interference-domain-containing protein [Cytidiella melzeri]|nr:NRDE-2, necessary for RNA interference-domain-containing protein [Cytidiella melzeri]